MRGEAIEVQPSSNNYAAWALLIVAVALHLAMMGSLFWGYFDAFFYSADRSFQALDFFAIYEAGHNALEGDSIYAVAHETSSNVPYASPYRYVPGFAYIFGVPANLLPAWWAYWTWVAFNEVMLVANAFATYRLSDGQRWGIVGAAMWFVFTPFYLEQYQGQFSFLMTTLIFATGVGLLFSRQWLACGSWVLSLVTKTATALAAPVFVRLGWWWTIVAGLAVSAMSAVYFPFVSGSFERFVDLNFQLTNESEFRNIHYWPGYQGGRSLLENVFLAMNTSETSAPIFLAAILGVSVLLISLCVTFLAAKADSLVLFALWLTSFFLVYDTVWEFHYVMLLGPLVLLVVFRPRLRLISILAFVLLALPTPYWLLNNVWNNGTPEFRGSIDLIQKTWPTWGVVWFHASKPVPVFALWAFLAWSALREGITLEWFTSRVPFRSNRSVTPTPAPTSE